MQTDHQYSAAPENVVITGCGVWLNSTGGSDAFWEVECGVKPLIPPLGSHSEATPIELFQRTLSDALEHSKLTVRPMEGKRVVLMCAMQGLTNDGNFPSLMTRHLHIINSVEEYTSPEISDPALLLERALDRLREGAYAVLVSLCNFSADDVRANGAVTLVLERQSPALRDQAPIVALFAAGSWKKHLTMLSEAGFICLPGTDDGKLSPSFKHEIEGTSLVDHLESRRWIFEISGKCSRSNHPWRSLLRTLFSVQRGVFPPDSTCLPAGESGAPSGCLRLWFCDGTTRTRSAAIILERGGSDAWLVQLSNAALPVIAAAPGNGLELYVFSANSPDALLQKLEQVGERAASKKLNPQTLAREEHEEWRAALVAQDGRELADLATRAAQRIRSQPLATFAVKSEMFYSGDPSVTREGKMVLMFPGQGSQFFHMNKDILLRFPQYRSLLEAWNSSQTDAGLPSPARWIYPAHIQEDAAERRAHQQKLISMECGGQAAFINSLAMYRFLASLGVSPDGMVGNSQGESCALVASGILDVNDAGILELLQYWRQHPFQNSTATDKSSERGVMLAATLHNRDPIVQLISHHKNKLFVALDNCPQQLVLFALPEIVDEVIEKIRAAGGLTLKLPFDRPYHTPLFERESLRLGKVYKDTNIGSGNFPVYSCLTTRPFPEGSEEVRTIARNLWHKPVLFRETVERMYADGVRLFVEVGPGSKLAGYVSDTLRGKSFVACSASSESRSSLAHLFGTLGMLFTRHRWDPSRLYPKAAELTFNFPANTGQPPVAKTAGATGACCSQETSY